MPQQFGVVVFGMADSKVREESGFLEHAGCLEHEATNCPVYVRLAGYRYTFVGEQGVDKTGANTQLELQFVPALKSHGLKVVFFYCTCQYIFQGGNLFCRFIG
jgi:hypothetical protein